MAIKILICDDDEARMVSFKLTKDNIAEVFTACDGDEAIEGTKL